MIELNMHLHAETAKAVLLSDDGKEENAKWYPKSQVKCPTNELNKVVEVEMPEWLAKKEELI
jgi:hypothetical protein